ncbi:MAG: helicase C-terminal domain-containing protein [Chlamydiota bacterium]
MKFRKDLLQEIFSEEGPLARLFGVFEAREGQLSMAEHVLRSFEQEEVALIEAGTGVGKSLAYLVPAVIWALNCKEKTVISTHTIALQEQLLKKDIPFLLKAVGADLKAVLVKGMSNYICLKKLDEHPDHPLRLFAENTAKEGCRSEMEFSVTADVWDQVKAESLSCSHVHCPHYRECFFFKARKTAEDAQILVVNHHLLLTDLAIKKKQSVDDERKILPGFTRLIIDEAHHFEQVALECLSKRVEGFGLLRALASILTEKHRLRLRQKLTTEKFNLLSHQIEIDLPLEKNQLAASIDEAFRAIKMFLPISGRKRFRSEREEFKNTFLSLKTSLTTFSEGLFSFVEAVNDKSSTTEIANVAGRLEEAADVLKSFFEGEESAEQVRLAEASYFSSNLIESSLDVSSILKENLFDVLATTILCSATLSSNKNFQYVRSRLGIESTNEKIYESPFDYAKRTLFAVPTDFPDPASPFFLKAAASAISSAIEASQGGAFVLFTSYEMLRAVYDLVAPYHKFPFLKQQDAARSILLERFKAKKDSVLFGTDSFWEGVDVPGDALRSVIIVKLPFRVPTDPIEEAQKESLIAKKIDPFLQKNIPEAVMKFKQGFGRLMRTKTDYGCVLCLDNRLLTKGYGKYFLNSLPPSPTLFAPIEQISEALRNFYKNLIMPAL